MAGGLGAMICLECLETTTRSPRRRRRSLHVPAPVGVDVGRRAPLAPPSHPQVRRAEHVLRTRMGRPDPRAEDSWAEIGKVLGVSRQAVWERFGSSKQAARTETA